MKTNQLTGAALDWAVAKCEGHVPQLRHEYMRATALANNYKGDLAWHLERQTNNPIIVSDKGGTSRVPDYSTNWAQGGPILSRERISRTIDHSGLWVAYWTDGYDDSDEGKKWMQCDRSELVAGLRCYVASKLGDEVDIPTELQ